MLITTLPPAYQVDRVMDMVSHPLVDALRYNLGTHSNLDKPIDILKSLLRITEKFNKPLMLDIDGRQLRVAESSKPKFAGVTLNHDFEVDLPAKVFLRNDSTTYTLLEKQGRRIFLDPTPEYVGKDQAVNIISKNFKVDKYLYQNDIEWLLAAQELGIFHIFASFFEKKKDIKDIWEVYPDARVKLKIESLPGVELLKQLDRSFFGITNKYNCHLVAARDDLSKSYGAGNPEIMYTLWKIAKKDPEAILASCLFDSLKSSSKISMADLSDLHQMQNFGYKHFLLGDNISHYRFSEAMENWKTYILRFPIE